MNYRLSLDVGTASLGIVALALDAESKPIEAVYSAVHIFSEPLLPAKSGGVGEPKKANRRLARQQRQLIERRSRRLRRIAHLAPLLGLEHKDVPPDDGQHIHELRAAATRQPIALPDLLNVFLKLAKRRGYAGGFKTKKEGEEGEVQNGIESLRSLLKANNAATLGDLLNQRFKRGESLKLKRLKLYADRDMSEREFESIWDEQAKHHAILNTRAEAYSVRGVTETLPVRQHFKEAIFHQRPLKSVAGMVGKCPLEPTLPRAPAAQPVAQAFRIEKQLADLRWGMGRSQRPLDAAQRYHVRAMLLDADQLNKDGLLTFKAIYKSLEKANLMPAFPRQFNTDRFSRETLVGDRTAKVMSLHGLLDAWRGLDDLTRLRIVNLVANLGSPEVVEVQTWQERMKHRPAPAVVDFINLWVNSGKFDRLSKMGLDGGRSAYSVKALQGLASKMRDSSLDEHGAKSELYRAPEATGELVMHLPRPDSTGNVVVDVALRVVRHGVNQCLAALTTPPTEVIVELSRDMALGISARNDKEASINKNRISRLSAKRKIEADNPGKVATNSDIFRYLLWDEQNTHCPYCNDRIALFEAMDGNATNIDHVLPRSLTQVKRLRSHLVIAHRSCNAAKGNEVALRAFANEPERIQAVEHCAEVLRKKRSFRKANYLLAESYEAELLNDETLRDFTERQFAESSWIAKLTALWMRDICPNVSVSRGELTAQLRRAWKLETVIPQVRLETRVDPKSEKPDNHLPLFDEDGKPVSREEFERFRPCWENHHGPEVVHTDRRIDKRIDHRHHLVDALVIGLTDRSLFMSMARGYKERMEQRAAGVRGIKPWQTPTPPLRNVRDVALKLVRGVKVQHKTDRRAAGALFNDKPYGLTDDDSGKKRITQRRELQTLIAEKDSVDDARKAIREIVSTSTRHIVSDAFEKRVGLGQSAWQALQEPISYTPTTANNVAAYRTIVRRVVSYQRDGRGLANGAESIRITHEQRAGQELVKAYMPPKTNKYAYVAIMAEGDPPQQYAISVTRTASHDLNVKRMVRRIFKLEPPRFLRRLLHLRMEPI